MLEELLALSLLKTKLVNDVHYWEMLNDLFSIEMDNWMK